MERVHIDFYSHSPRVSVNVILNVTTIPIVGDNICISKEYLKNIAHQKLRHMFRGLDFKVIKRIYGPCWYKSDEYIWQLKLEIDDPSFMASYEKTKAEKEKKINQTTKKQNEGKSNSGI